MSALLAAAQMDQRLLEEIYLKLEEVPFTQKVYKVIGDIRNIWNYEVWSIDSRPVTIRKLVVSFLILIIGLVIAFPQRDVHLDALRPLELRIVDQD